jgi:hypothetical protein
VLGFVTRRITRAAIGRGVFGESRFWLVVAIVLGIRFLARKLGGGEPELLYSEELGPRDRLVIGPVSETQ